MKAIGFRCFNDKFAFVVLEGSQGAPKTIERDCLNLPGDRSWGGRLAWVRKQVIEILRRNEVSAAGIKRAETTARKAYPKRSEIEGVVKEAVFSHLRLDCVAHLKQQLKKAIAGFSEPARYLPRALNAGGLQTINTSVYRDAALVALAQLPEDACA